MQTNMINSSRQRLWLWPQGRSGSPNGGFVRWFLLLTLLVTAVTGVRADGYVTDIMVVGYSSGGWNSVKQYTSQGWVNVGKDLNDNAGGWDIFLLYKTSTTANPETGYITDIVVSTTKWETGFDYDGRHYEWAPRNSGFNGDLNRDAGGADIFMYYTRDRANLSTCGGTKRVIETIGWSKSWSNANNNQINVQWYSSKYSGGADMNKDAGGDDIYIKLNFTTQTLSIKNEPTLFENIIYTGSPLNLVSAEATGNYGTMKYRVDGGAWTTNPTATTVGSHSVDYRLEATFANSSSISSGRSVNIYPVVQASNLQAEFNQIAKTVTLNWNVGDIPGNYTDYQWTVYRGDVRIATLDPGVTTYTDNGFENEQDVSYSVYFIPALRSVEERYDDAKATATVNTKRSVPVNNLQAVSSENKVTLTWTSVDFPASADMNNKFDVYIDNNKVATITPATGQTSFKWEHRDDNQATGRTDYTDKAAFSQEDIDANIDAYTVEDLDACNVHTYRVVGQIDDTELNSAEQRDKAIGGGTTFENFVCSKGDNQGSVLLTWNVKRLKNQAAENYVIERRVLSQENNEDSWQKLTTLDSDKTFMTWEDKTTLPGVFYEYRITCYNYCENGNRPTTTTTDTGFALSSGVISGRITYGTGTAVENVKVTLRQNNDDGETVNHLRSLQFRGTGTGMLCTTTAKELKKLTGGDFSIQAYVNPSNAQMNADGTAYMLYDISGLFAIVLKYNAAQQTYQLGAFINGENRFADQYIPANQWSHVSCVYSKSAQTTTFYVTTDADHIASGSITGQTVATATSETELALGNSVTLDNAHNFGGYLDEFRFFKRALTQNDIRKNFNRPMGGTESGLAIYYPMDENMGVQNIVYDFSKSNNTSNGHHATAHVPALSSDFVPTEEQLSLMGLTDGQGNYVIRGVPFSGEGTNYTVIPTMGIHEFSPAYASRYVSASSLVHNGVDFGDVSSFPVSGSVRYAGTDHPVEGCNIYVDGQISSKNGEPITTNVDGAFTVSVPIGEHFIEVRKNGHTFTNAGRYPADPNGTGKPENFQKKLTGLEFIDETLVNFTGRVVGGSIEGDKPVGFGLSKNNIGVVELVLSPLNELYRMNVVKNVTETTSSLDTNNEEVTVPSATTAINSTSFRGATANYCKNFYIWTDPNTGEFSAMLPPLQYKVESVKVKKSELDLGVSTTIDLTNPLEVSQDSVRTEDDELLTYDYVAMLKHTYHSTPTFTVEQEGRNDGSFGINSFKLKDLDGELVISDIYSVSNGVVTYNYRGPLFVKSDPYTFLLKGFEEYTNNDEEQAVTSRVPLAGVVVTIDNALSDGQSVYVDDGTVDGEAVKAGDVVELQSNQIELNDEGEAIYNWRAGFPNISEPYTRTININYDIEGRVYAWSGNGMEGVVLGDLPTGNNFVTSGPDQLLMILRDPPGSASNAEWSTGTVSAKTKTVSNGATEDGSLTFEHKFGVDVETITGALPGAAVVNQVAVKNDSEVGFTFESSQDDSDSFSTTTSITKAWATKGEPEYVGAQGDVFIGNSTNFIFGKARNLGFRRDPNTNTASLQVFDIMTSGMRFGTLFSYTQKYIEDTLFPNLLGIRDNFLQTVSESTYNNYVNEGNDPVYVTKLDKDDENFGKPGTYKVVMPQTMSAELIKKLNEEGMGDTIQWVNNQLENWTRYLELNEKEKVEAVTKGKLLDNYSFDSGSDVSYSVETDTTRTSSFEWTVSPGIHIANTTGTEINHFGLDISFEVNASYSHTESKESETSNVNSFAFTLSETGDADALSVDVYQYGIFSPIFRTRGGQTSAPYEGEVRTEYYEDENGNHPIIMEATMQIEVPQIDVEVPVVSDIPSGSAANYVLKLSNASEVGADVAYRLMMLDDTNSQGVQLTMDGMPLTGEGRLIKVPGNQTLTKALQLRQTDTGVLDYENIGIVFASDSEPDDIFDVVYISAHFTPSSSAVDLALSNNIVNTQTGTNLKLTFNHFDRNYKNLKAFRLQYKKQGSTDWTLLHEYVLDEKNKTQNNELLPAGASIDYMLNMSQFTDGDYLFRTLSVATYGTGEVYRSSEELALVKDMQRPRPLGQPEPADGILSAGDELSVTFNETILKGELTQAANFKVTGVLNGAEVAHETALSMQSTEAAAKTEADILLAGKDFSIDAWVNLPGGAGTLLSHGKGNAKMTVGTDADNHMVMKIGSETYTSDAPVPTGSWVFLTLNYRNENGAYKMSATAAKDADMTQLFVAKEVAKYEGNGPLSVGCGSAGAMHELLLWDEAHDMTTALAQRGRTKNPATRHLIGYWKMDEGEGKTIRDYSRNRHMTMANETWYMNNENKAVNLTDGQYLSIDASDLPAYGEDDYALEFWVRGTTQTGEAQLLQMGEIGLWVNATGELQLTGKGAYLGTEKQTSIATTSGKLTDNAWHHIALNVLRQGAAAIYVDGVRRLSTNAANVGGIATNNLLIGTHRQTLSEHGEYSYDRPFTGQVDELRVWNATLNADKLLSNHKVRLTGSEDGLSAYYPFETKQLDQYSQVVTTASAEDLARKGHTAVAIGGSPAESPAEIAFTDDAPALRQKKTETNVPFTFVASDEKVVITIDEEPAMIEGCTLNFTVRDVRDENGNYSVPAVWSAFVNQNQLVWAENALSVEQPLNTTSTLQATVVNKGGQQQMWTLTGMPAWLVPSVENGETNPLAETKVDFTIMPSAPVGRNEVTVYLTGNDNIDVPLTLNIKVNGDTPDWAVNPNDFDGSMNIIGQLYIDGVISNDADDILAAFIGEECRGVANLEYSPRYDSYFATMDIYGSTDDVKKAVTFRAYDASTGTLYPVVNPTSAVSYAPLALKGSYAEPELLTTADYIEQQTNLRKGWNWISLYVNMSDMSPQTIFNAIADDVLTVKSKSDGFVENSENGLQGELTALANGKMYAVQMSNDRTLRLVGNRASETVSVDEGWNWLGYGQYFASVTDALASMSPANGDVLKGQQGVTYYDSYAWAGSLLTMQPGKGYQLKSSKAATITYPSTVTGVAGSRMASAEANSSLFTLHSSLFAPVDHHLFADNMVMTAQVIKDGTVLTDAEIGVFADGDECRATAFTREDGRAYMTIPGDEECQLTIQVAVAGKLYSTKQTVDYAVDAVCGSYSQPFVINLGDALGINEVENGLSIDSSVYDLQGRKILTGKAVNRKVSKGVYVKNGKKKVMK